MSSMRISGLASGMDIEQIISDMMKVRRMPLDKLFQEKQELEWKQEDYRTLNSQLSKFRESVFNLKLQGTFNVKSASSSNEDVVEVSASGGAVAGTYNLAVTQLAEGAYKTSSAALGSSGDTSTLNSQLGLSGTVAFTINGENISIDADSESIYALVAKINDADAGVSASYDSELDRFFLSTTETGAQAEIAITDGADDLGVDLFADALNIDVSAVQGKDALFELNGTELSKSSNQFTISGVNYDLKGVSETDAGSDPVATTITVQSDTDQIFNTIVGFVETYNETIFTINGELNETYYRDYPPLTDDMREQLDEDQIEKWTEKARSGMLRNDSTLTSIVSQLRMDIYSVVEGVSGEYSSLSQIGISTGLYHEQGKLYIDESKLRQAIADDPEGIGELFTATSDDGSSDNEGIAVRLYDDAVDGISRLTTKAGSSSGFSLVDNSVIGERIRQIDERMDDYEDRLEQIEDRYWRQFTAMEEAIQMMNSQATWLQQQLGMWSGQ